LDERKFFDIAGLVVSIVKQSHFLEKPNPLSIG